MHQLLRKNTDMIDQFKSVKHAHKQHVLATLIALTFFQSSDIKAAQDPLRRHEKAFSTQVQSSPDTPERRVRVRFAENIAPDKIRLFTNAYESQSGVFFPITTLGRSAFQITLLGEKSRTFAPTSLSTFSTMFPAQRRSMVIAVSDHKTMPETLSSEIRKSLIELLPSAKSEFLSILSISKTLNTELINVSQQQSENIKAIQKELLNPHPRGEGISFTNAVCAAADRFYGWDQSDFTLADQKVAIIISAPMDPVSTTFMTRDVCFKKLEKLNVRVFLISFDDVQSTGNRIAVQSAIDASHGFTHVVASPLDVFPALSNIFSYLNDEYVIELNVPKLPAGMREAAIRLDVSYYNNVFFTVTNKIQLPFAPREIVALPQKTETGDVTAWEPLFFLLSALLIGTLGSYVLIRSNRLAKTTVFCSRCHRRVQKNFSDCPYLLPACVGRLVVIRGEHAGIKLPIFRGENILGWNPKHAIGRWNFRDFRFNHAKIIIKSDRALYQPLGHSTDTINGWPVYESRLLGTGSIIKIGNTHYRFEAKPPE